MKASVSVSTPMKGHKVGLPMPSNNAVKSSYDLLVWFEICELASTGMCGRDRCAGR